MRTTKVNTGAKGMSNEEKARAKSIINAIKGKESIPQETAKASPTPAQTPAPSNGVMKFKLLSGTHNESGVLYKAGDIIESKRDLGLLFLNRFQCLSPRREASPVTMGVGLVQNNGLFDIVTKAGIRVNDIPLSGADAEDIKRGGWQTVHRVWNGGTCFVLGGGPSLAKFDLSALKGRNKIIGVNHTAFMLQTPVMFFVDKEFVDGNFEEIAGYKGLRVTTHESFTSNPAFYCVKGTPDTFAESNAYISAGRNSGIGAISLARHMGADKIVLVGFDMKESGGKWHWYEKGGDNTPWRNDVLKRHIENFKLFAERAALHHVEIFNTNADSALVNMVPYVDYKEALQWRA